MAVYKVPQDVEAEDKLIGPFSFRQFIYLIIAALGILAGYLLAQLFVGLAIIPLPVIALFLILALPLRKDQPMETYLIALVRFFLKPRQRLWDPDGAMGLVQITAPKTTEVQLTKNFGADEASQRLDYLAQLVDTRGWSTRGVMDSGGPMNDDVIAEAQQAEDVLDEGTNVARSFDNMIEQSDTSYKQSVKEQFQQAWRQPVEPDAPVHSFTSKFSMGDFKSATPGPGHRTASDEFNYDPYPNSMHQRVIFPAGEGPATPQPQPMQIADEPRTSAVQDNTAAVPPLTMTDDPQKQQTPSKPPVSPDIMRLVTNNDLSISAIAHEAHRLEQKDDNEVVISLR